MLIKAFGKDSSDWVGERIELYAGEVKYQGGMTPSVLVRALEREPGAEKKRKTKPKSAAAAPAKAQRLRDDLNDELPDFP